MSAAQPLPLLSPQEMPPAAAAGEERGFGALSTARGNLPLRALEVSAKVTGLVARVVLVQSYVNPFDELLEATYVFPLPARGAVTGLRMEVDGRVVEGLLKERGEARAEYDAALQAGQRAAIAEEERPDVFTLRVGNLGAREEARLTLHLTVPLTFADGEATFRFPLVVAPRYIPGTPLPGEAVGDGVVADTDAVPDASRIRPPVLLPGFPSPVRLALAVEVEPAGLEVGPLRSSLHAVAEEVGEGGRRKVTVVPGARLDADFLLRFAVAPKAVSTALSLKEDGEGGTFLLTLVPPAQAARALRPRDVVFVLDRSGSMGGWKMVAARRALGRMVDTLTEADRFSVLLFDNEVERPGGLPARGLVAASDRARFRCVEALGQVEGRGGTEMLEPLREALAELAGAEAGRERILVLVTDGQVGNEDQLLRELGPRLAETRVFTVGVDTAVNAGFLQRMAALGGGACELLESEERLDEAMARIHRRLAPPVLEGLSLLPEGLTLAPDTLVPARLPALFPGVPLVVSGRFQGRPSPEARMKVEAKDALGRPWRETVKGEVSDNAALSVLWARGQLRQLEDRYAIGAEDVAALEKRILATSLAHGVLCRFTAFVAVDRAGTKPAGGPLHRVTQPVELPRGWVASAAAAAPLGAPPPMARAAAPLMEAKRVSTGAFAAASAPGAAPEMTRGGGMPSPALLSRLRRKEKGKPPAPELELSDDEGGLPPLDVSAYRRRAGELAEALSRAPGAEGLAALGAALAVLVEDVASTAPGHAALAGLKALLEAVRTFLSGTPGAQEVAALVARARAELEAFATGGDAGGPPPPPAPKRKLSFWR